MKALIKELKKMKKNIIYAVALCVLGMFAVSCSSTKSVQSPADEYEDETAQVAEDAENGDSVEIKSSNKKEKKQKDPKKKNFIQEMFTFGNRDDYNKLYEISLYEKEITGMKEKRATALLRTDNYMTGFGCYYMMAYYIVQFDEIGRTKLRQGIESYLSDFENKNLQRKGKHTDRAYGKTPYRLDWGTVSSSTPNKGTGEGYMGYEFIKGSPYFVLSDYAFSNDNYERIGDTTSRESLPLSFYFTRAQLREVLELISEDNVKKVVAEMNENYITTGADEY